MKLNLIRAYDGLNINEIKKLFKIEVEAEDIGEVYSYLKRYFYINYKIGTKEKLISIAYSFGKAEMWVTYTHFKISKYILESFEVQQSIDNIIANSMNILENCWQSRVIIEAERKNIPFIINDEDTLQLGYGKNSIRVKEDNYEFINIEQAAVIPIISVTGTNGKTTTARITYHILSKLGYITGLASTGGIFINNENIKQGDTTGYISAREILKREEVEAAVLETARGGIIKRGLGYDRAKVAIITSLSEDHIGMGGINDLDELAKVKALTTKALDHDGVIIMKGEEKLLRYIDKSKELYLFDIEKTYVLAKHFSKKGRGFYLGGEHIRYFNGYYEQDLINIKNISFTHSGISYSNVKNLMAALGATMQIHKNIEDIINVVKELKCDLTTNPGRQNILDIKDFKVILDYGHNSEAFYEVFEIAKKLEPSRVTSIISAAGDRKDLYIKELGEISAKYSDYIIIREQEDLRGRLHGEIASIIKSGVEEGRYDMEKCITIYKEQDALKYAMKKAIKGEVIVLFTQCLDVVIPVINEYLMSIGEQTFRHPY